MRKALALLPLAFPCPCVLLDSRLVAGAAVYIPHYALHTIVYAHCMLVNTIFAGGVAPRKPYPVPSADSIQPYQAPAAPAPPPAPPAQEPIRWTQVRLW